MYFLFVSPVIFFVLLQKQIMQTELEIIKTLAMFLVEDVST